MTVSHPSDAELGKIWKAKYVIRKMKPQEWRVLQVKDIVQLERAALLLEPASQPHVIAEHSLFDSAGPEPLGLHVMGDLLTGSFASLREAVAAVEVSAPAPQAEGVCWPIPEDSDESWAVLVPDEDKGFAPRKPGKGDANEMSRE